MNETQTEYCYECLHSSNKMTPHKKGYRVCHVCKVEKKYSEFYIKNATPTRRTNPHSISYDCKECQKKIRKERYHNDPVKARNRDLKRRYGITLDDYDRILVLQNNKCAICNSTSSGKKNNKYFVVDHCHTTGKIRGLLCHGCNVGMGHLQDDVELLEKAIAYLGEMNK